MAKKSWSSRWAPDLGMKISSKKRHNGPHGLQLAGMPVAKPAHPNPVSQKAHRMAKIIVVTSGKGGVPCAGPTCTWGGLATVSAGFRLPAFSKDS